MKDTMTELIIRAHELGIPNPSMYWLLPPDKRVKKLKEAIAEAEKAAQSKDE